MVDYAPGMRTIIRDEEWMVKKIEKNNLGNLALHCIGISSLVKDKEVIFLTDLEDIKVVNPAEVQLIPDNSSHFRRTQLYLESQWRRQIPTDTDLHIGDKAAMDLMPYQLESAQISLRRPRQRIWYDADGRIVFTTNRSLKGVGCSRPEWENGIKEAPAGQKFYRTITDDTMPGGLVERTIEYVTL